jgi:diacylglycerol O-acyltransferase
MTDHHLSALDMTFLELEDADDSAHMHIGAVLIFEGPAPSPADLLARVRAQLSKLPRFRQRLSQPRVGWLHRPTWEPATTDPGDQIGIAALPAPAGRDELLAWAGEFYSQRLDRHRPLWELALVSNLSDGRWALATKIHHCLADGIGSLESMRLFTDGAEQLPIAVVAGSPEPGVADAVRAALGLARHPRHTLETSLAAGELMVRNELVGAPASSINQPIGTLRRIEAYETTVDDLRSIKAGLGGTVNDVVLAAVTAGLRALLHGRDDDLATLRAMVPVNVRDPDGAGLGNRVVSLFVDLPVGEDDPLRRYDLVREQTARAKHGSQPAGTQALLAAAEWLPPILHTPFAQSLFGKRLFNVTVTNVPGPREQVYAFGCPIAEAIPIVPLAAEHAVGVAVLSQAGRLVFCINADRDSVTDVARMRQGIADGIAELQAGLVVV